MNRQPDNLDMPDIGRAIDEVVAAHKNAWWLERRPEKVRHIVLAEALADELRRLGWAIVRDEGDMR
jgi:hypothetical protein